jgi:hypothetical protein
MRLFAIASYPANWWWKSGGRVFAAPACRARHKKARQTADVSGVDAVAD